MKTKQHYVLLDGLRGVAALMVLGYHLFEAIAFSSGEAEQQLYHGYLGVDFFFILSGFVMGYAYDDRWKQMTTCDFIRRRLIRLHPMIVMGVMLGLAAFLIQGCTLWDGTVVSWSAIGCCTVLSLLLLPALAPWLDVRGNTELFPLNGPHWSLFFEYIGSLLYALMLRKLSTKWLRAWVCLAACALMANAFFQGGVGQGWSREPLNMLGGFLRLSFGYPVGLLLAREFRTIKESNRFKQLNKYGAFASAIVLVALLCVPSFSFIKGFAYGNTIFELLCLIVFFPMIVIFAAHVKVGGIQEKVYSYVGRLSYPLYAVHYPFIYLYIHWLNTEVSPFGTWTYATPLAVSVMSIITAILCLHLYDEPLRKWLQNTK